MDFPSRSPGWGGEVRFLSFVLSILDGRVGLFVCFCYLFFFFSELRFTVVISVVILVGVLRVVGRVEIPVDNRGMPSSEALIWTTGMDHLVVPR